MKKYSLFKIAYLALATAIVVVYGDTAEEEIQSGTRVSRSISNLARLILGGNVPPDHPLVQYPDAASTPAGGNAKSSVLAAVPGMSGVKQDFGPMPTYPAYQASASQPSPASGWPQSNQGYNAPPVQQPQLPVSNSLAYSNSYYSGAGESLHPTTTYPQPHQNQANPTGFNTPGNYYNAPSNAYTPSPTSFPPPGNTYNAPNYGSGRGFGSSSSSFGQSGNSVGNTNGANLYASGATVNPTYTTPYIPSPVLLPQQYQQQQPAAPTNTWQQQPQSYSSPPQNYQQSPQINYAQASTQTQGSYFGQTSPYQAQASNSYNGASNNYLNQPQVNNQQVFNNNYNNQPQQTNYNAPPIYNPPVQPYQNNPTQNNYNPYNAGTYNTNTNNNNNYNTQQYSGINNQYPGNPPFNNFDYSAGSTTGTYNNNNYNNQGSTNSNYNVYPHLVNSNYPPPTNYNPYPNYEPPTNQNQYPGSPANIMAAPGPEGNYNPNSLSSSNSNYHYNTPPNPLPTPGYTSNNHNFGATYPANDNLRNEQTGSYPQDGNRVEQAQSLRPSYSSPLDPSSPAPYKKPNYHDYLPGKHSSPAPPFHSSSGKSFYRFTKPSSPPNKYSTGPTQAGRRSSHKDAQKFRKNNSDNRWNSFSSKSNLNPPNPAQDSTTITLELPIAESRTLQDGQPSSAQPEESYQHTQDSLEGI